jgi:hypothetical protein
MHLTASLLPKALLYGRSVVKASKTSAMAIILEIRGISFFA